MSRDYNKIQKDIALKGFFSEYLPPCFYLDPKVLNNPPPEKCDLISPYSFSMSRFNGNNSRRTIFIPEIGSYIAAYQYMKEKHIIKELIEFSESEDNSFSPILGKQDDIVKHEQVYSVMSNTDKAFTSEYIENIGKKIIKSAGAIKVLKLDISNCFSSFYMHMMPAIILGADVAQKDFDKYRINPNDNTISDHYKRYRKLDEVIRRQNMNKTNGLLTGILSSRIIMEAMLTRIDKELSSVGINFVRYVDDYEVFLYDDSEKKIISEVSKVLKKYGFTINAEKTQIVDFPYYIVENFNKILGKRLNSEINSEELIDIFNSFILMEQSGTKGAIRFLLKTIEKNIENIEIEDPNLFKAYLISIMTNNERSLTKSCSILISEKDKYILSSEDILNIKRILKNHLAYNHDLEVLWLLYLLIKTGNISKGDGLIKEIIKKDNELVNVLLFKYDMLGEEEISLIKLKATSWILLYELYAKDIINKQQFTEKLKIVKNIDMYINLKIKNISFIKDV